LGFGTTLGADHTETLSHALSALNRNTISCAKCINVIVKIRPIEEVLFYYPEIHHDVATRPKTAISLVDRFRHTFGKVHLGTYKCNICEGRSISDQNKTLERPLKVLMMVLRRKMYNPESVGEENLRINSRVDFPLTDFMPSDRQDIHYNLFAVINNHQSSKSGQYTGQCKINASPHWCNYNDNNYKMDTFIDKRNKNKILIK
jgi:hypothetical protein